MPPDAQQLSSTPSSAVFVGDGTLVLQCADMARQAGLDVALLVLRGLDLLDRAAQLGFATGSPEDLENWLDDNSVDVLLSIANEYVLSDDLLAKGLVGIEPEDVWKRRSVPLQKRIETVAKDMLHANAPCVWPELLKCVEKA